MTTALIADDEPHLASYLRAQLATLWPELLILPLARNGVEAAESIAANAPDLAFLDIKMPGLSGLEVAQGIEGATRVVFVTAYDEFAVQAFDQEAIDYVLKPVNAQRLARCIERVRRYRDAGCDQLLCLMNPYAIPADTVMRSIELFGEHVIPAFRDA